jgi:hypothetical protein
MRQLDAKMRVLTAIYAEYQKDVPDMSNVNPRALRMDWPAFRAAVMKLQNEELIRGLIIRPPEAQLPDVEYVRMDGVLPTLDGLRAVEHFIETGEADTATERLERLKKAVDDVCETEVRQIAEEAMKAVKKANDIRNMRGLE